MGTTAATLMELCDPQIFDVENNVLWALADDQMASLRFYLFVELLFTAGPGFPVNVSERSPRR